MNIAEDENSENKKNSENKISVLYFQFSVKSISPFPDGMGYSCFEGDYLLLNRKRAGPAENGWCLRTKVLSAFLL